MWILNLYLKSHGGNRGSLEVARSRHTITRALSSGLGGWHGELPSWKVGMCALGPGIGCPRYYSGKQWGALGTVCGLEWGLRCHVQVRPKRDSRPRKGDRALQWLLPFQYPTWCVWISPRHSVASGPAKRLMLHALCGDSWWGPVGNGEERCWNMGTEWGGIQCAHVASGPKSQAVLIC